MNIYLYKMISGTLHVGELLVDEKQNTFKILEIKGIKEECGTYQKLVKKSDIGKIDGISASSYKTFILRDSKEQRDVFINKCIAIENNKIKQLAENIKHIEHNVCRMIGELNEL